MGRFANQVRHRQRRPVAVALGCLPSTGTDLRLALADLPLALAAFAVFAPLPMGFGKKVTRFLKIA